MKVATATRSTRILDANHSGRPFLEPWMHQVSVQLMSSGSPKEWPWSFLASEWSPGKEAQSSQTLCLEHVVLSAERLLRGDPSHDGPSPVPTTGNGDAGTRSCRTPSSPRKSPLDDCLGTAKHSPSHGNKLLLFCDVASCDASTNAGRNWLVIRDGSLGCQKSSRCSLPLSTGGRREPLAVSQAIAPSSGVSAV